MKQIIATLIALLFTISVFSQIEGKGEIAKQARQVGTFNSIKITGAQDAVLMNGDEYSVVIETNENLFDHISVVIQNEMLWIDYDKIKNYDKLKLYITTPEYKKIVVSGASDVKSADTLRGASLRVSASGASDILLLLNYEDLNTNASGASDVTFKGVATNHNAQARGASNITAKELKTTSTELIATGASTCFVEASASLVYDISGTSIVKYIGTPQSLVIRERDNSKNVVSYQGSGNTSRVYTYSDTTTVHLGALDVEVIEGDTTRVSVGRHTLIVDDNGNVTYERNKKIRFNGHWGGVELGINGYITPDFNTNWGSEYDYLNLRYEKSIAVNLNIYEQNIALNKAKNMGIVTGLGLAWNNYSFSQQTYLSPDSSEVYGFYIEGASVRKTKLTAMYITLPVMFEVQTKNPRRFKRFHFGIGALISARVRTHTKIYFNNPNQNYQLYDPKTESYAPGVYVTPNVTNRNIIKNYNSFYLQPFKFDGMLRIGYSFINVFATYSLNSLFQKDRGPQLNAWTAGITLVGW